MIEPKPLAGKVAFVTGAARGIGRAIAIDLAEAGAAVAVADLHPRPFTGERYYRLRKRVSGPEEEISTADTVRSLGVAALELELDVANHEAVVRAAERAASELGPVDVLVNNAGIVNNLGSLAEMAPEAWEHEVRVNLGGAYHCIRTLAPAMAQRGWGRVVNISSVAARSPALGQPAYAASKAGVIALTQSTAQEFGPGGVTCNAVLPGLMATPLVLSMPEELRQRVTERVPLGRLGELHEIAALVTFLASPAAAFVSGTAIPCDGGLLGAAREG